MRQYLINIIRGEDNRFRDRIILLLLSLLEIFYLAVVLTRNLLYNLNILKSKELKCRVISVGNITTGGTGKTPAVERLAGMLKEQGQRVVVISRGYKSASKEPRVITDGNRIKVSVEEAGDEVYMLARHLQGIPVVIGRNRYQAGMLARDKFSPDVIILDDAFQHRQLARDLDIVVINARQPFGYNHLLPRGFLREPLSALKRADVFIISRIDQVEEEQVERIKNRLRKYNQKANIYSSYHNPVQLKSLTSEREDIYPADYIKGKKVLALSGIGNPESFLESLKTLEARVVESINYPDHYKYEEQDLMEIAVQAQLNNADWVVTTEKDAVKFREEMFVRFRRLDVGVCTLDIELKLDNNDGFAEGIFN